MKPDRPWILLCLLVGSMAISADEAPRRAAAEIARSSLLTLSGVAEQPSLTLWARRGAEQAPLVITEFGAAIDGKSVAATRAADGGWTVPLGNLGAGDHHLDVIVGHDGIRELLAGKFAASTASARPAAGITGLGGNHKQLLWWILNIGIVLVAAIAISRRMS